MISPGKLRVYNYSDPPSQRYLDDCDSEIEYRDRVDGWWCRSLDLDFSRSRLYDVRQIWTKTKYGPRVKMLCFMRKPL